MLPILTGVPQTQQVDSGIQYLVTHLVMAHLNSAILSASERDTLLALPDSQDDLIRYYTFNESDLSLIRQRQRAARSGH